MAEPWGILAVMFLEDGKLFFRFLILKYILKQNKDTPLSMFFPFIKVNHDAK